MNGTTRRLGLAILAIAAGLLAAGCGASHSGSAGAAASSARAAASSARANPTVSADVQAAETLLLANFQKEIKATPAHPVKAARAAVHDTFPAGDTAKIENYAVQTFTVTAVHSTQDRHQWAAGVASYALAEGGSTASPGSANIPGASAPAPSASAS
jgi:hypothetical protein